MPERETAESRLERILYLLPAAAREGGASLGEIAAALGVSVAQLLRDLEDVTARVYYHPAGGADDLQILVEADRVRLWTAGEFMRPTKLGPREALALCLGLRMLALESEGDRCEALLELAQRLERELATAPARAFLPRYGLDDGAGSGDAIRGALIDAARDRRRCSIRYLKPGDQEPSARVVDPYVVVSAGGRWYVIGRDAGPGEVRVFRLDRILEASPIQVSFEIPADFDADDYVTDGHLFRADRDELLRVRYSAQIARWIREREKATEEYDGSVVVEHRTADPGWSVRHVLQYGPDAEILEPPGLRRLAGRTAWRVAERHGAAG